MVKISAQKMQSMKASGVIEQFSVLSNVTKLVQEFRVQCEEIEFRKDRSAASLFSFLHPLFDQPSGICGECGKDILRSGCYSQPN
jgi:hypothetical protein